MIAAAVFASIGAAPASADVVAEAAPVKVLTAGASSSTSAAIKRRFGVFRRKKTRRDSFPARNKKKRAEAAAIDSRLVYSAAKFKVYLYVRDNAVCIARMNSASAAGTCGSLRSYLTATPPGLIMLGASTAPAEVIIPVVDGVSTIARVDTDGIRTALPVRNNIVVDTPTHPVHYEWRQPSGIVATALNRR